MAVKNKEYQPVTIYEDTLMTPERKKPHKVCNTWPAEFAIPHPTGPHYTIPAKPEDKREAGRNGRDGNRNAARGEGRGPRGEGGRGEGRPEGRGEGRGGRGGRGRGRRPHPRAGSAQACTSSGESRPP